MATVNLGSIKFKWKGTYAGGTAYTVDDVVSYNGSSYICILASTGNLPTNATYFEQMSSAGTNGTNGTDLTTTLTTQGDIVYRDGSQDLQRLGAGTSGQFLQTNGAGANPSWGTVNSGLVQTVEQSYRTGFTQSLTGSTFTPLNNGSTDIEVQITPTSASNKILIWAMLGYFSPNDSSTQYGASARIERKIGAGSYDGTFDRSNQVGSNRPRGLFYVPQVYSDNYNPGYTFVSYDSTYGSTSTLTYRLTVMPHGSQTAQINYPINHGDTNSGYSASSVTRLIAQEIA
jgi:hypothetical protein